MSLVELMPNPYRGKERPLFGPEQVATRPKLATHIAVIAAMWTQVENRWGVILAEMLESNASVGVTMFLSLTGATSQTAVLEAVANKRLREPLLTEFNELHVAFRKTAKQRNTIVHGWWGGVTGKEDFLVLGNGDWPAKAVAEMHAYTAAPSVLGMVMPDLVLLKYTEWDFLDIQKRISSLHARQDAFRASMRAEREKRQSLVSALLGKSDPARG
jgi:hypothetical protein